MWSDFFHIWLSEIHALCPRLFFGGAGETWLDPWKIWRNCGKSTWEFLQIPANPVGSWKILAQLAATILLWSFPVPATENAKSMRFPAFSSSQSLKYWVLGKQIAEKTLFLLFYTVPFQGQIAFVTFVLMVHYVPFKLILINASGSLMSH